LFFVETAIRLQGGAIRQFCLLPNFARRQGFGLAHFIAVINSVAFAPLFEIFVFCCLGFESSFYSENTSPV
jgi:hypothetical protein